MKWLVLVHTLASPDGSDETPPRKLKHVNYEQKVLTVIFTKSSMKCKTTVKLIQISQYTKICKNAYFYALKCRKKSLLFSQTKSYYFSLFFYPNLPIFGFSRLAALMSVQD